MDKSWYVADFRTFLTDGIRVNACPDMEIKADFSFISRESQQK